MINLFLVALGGAVGSVLRYLAGVWALHQFGPSFPWGTMGINILGSFAIGLASELIMRRLDGSPEMRLLIMTGILGGFTTFSAFSLEITALIERGNTLAGAGYILASVILSVVAVFGGLALGRAML